jgi:SAM-dependent methyltransferase
MESSALCHLEVSENQFQYTGNELEAMSFARNYGTWILDEFEPFLGKSVLEVGAGLGNFSAMLLQTDIERLIAVEPSEDMYSRLCHKFQNVSRVKIFQAFLGETHSQFRQTFDTIFYVNVLEHIERDTEELSYVREILKQDGYLCIFVPALTWLYSRFDKEIGHYRRYKKIQLEKIIRSSGFSIIKLRYFDILGIIPWYIMVVLLKKKLVPMNVSYYDRFVVPTMRIVERVFPVPIGKNLLLVAKKNNKY